MALIVSEQELRNKIAEEILNAKGHMGFATIIPDDLKENVRPVWEAARLFYADIARGANV